MKAKELNVEYKEKTQEDIAKKVITDIMEHIADLKKKTVKAEEKLEKALEKDIVDIKEEDGQYYNWDD